jgi:hypothetical protein
LDRFQPPDFEIGTGPVLQSSKNQELGVEIVDARVTLGDLSDPRLTDALWAGEKKQSSQGLLFYVHKVASPSIAPDCPFWSGPALIGVPVDSGAPEAPDGMMR